MGMHGGNGADGEMHGVQDIMGLVKDYSIRGRSGLVL